MYQKVLVSLDGSELAELVLPYAAQLSGRVGSEVTLMFVTESAKYQNQHMYRVYLQKMAEVIQEKAQRYVAEPGEKVIEVRSVVAVGEPAEEIVDYADKNGIGLIVMATRGRSGIRRWALGSVADKVVRAAKQPVVLIRAKGAVPETLPGKDAFNKLLVALDGSKEGEAALPYVEELAIRLKAEIVLLQVVAQAYHVYTFGDGSTQIPYTEEEMKPLEANAASYLEKAGALLRDKGITTTSQVRVGSAADEIIKVADELRVDMVAMSTHGRSGVGRWAFGSVADRVLREGNTPVLVVRAP